MIKAIFFDIDGTLFSHASKEIPASTRRAIERLREQGIACLLASGRHRENIRHLIDDTLIFDGYVMSNGQLGYDSEWRRLFHMPIPEADFAFVLDLFQRHEMAFLLEDEEHQFANFINEQVRASHERITTPMPELGEYKGTTIYQMVAYGTPEELQWLDEKLADCKMTYWDPLGVDIVAAAGGKIWGIQQMIGHLGLDASEVMAFGDGENDIDMLRFAGIGVAMGNAEAEVKAVADYVTDDIDADGIWKALCHFGVIADEE